MKIASIIVLSVLVMLVGVVWYFDSTERQESHFSTYEELTRSGLIQKGWVPDFIPRSAYNINENHRVDVPRVNVKFRFALGDTAQIEESCTRQGSGDGSVACYKCVHRTDTVVVRLNGDGRGEIFSE